MRTAARAAAKEYMLLIALAACAIAWAGLPANPFVALLLLIAPALGCTLAVVRHAEHLAERLGEPYGTIILTLSVTIIEVVAISALMAHGAENSGSDSSGVARDTIYAVVMILLNLTAGIALLAGGWRHLELQFNLQSANAYLGVIIPLTVFALILPDFTHTTPGPTLSSPQEAFIAFVSLGLYAAFLVAQAVRHHAYFAQAGSHASDEQGHPAWPHAVLLAAYMIPLVYLAEHLGEPVETLLHQFHAPQALGGTLVALLIATPEALGAIRAAINNQLQRSVNIFMGSVLSSIGLTIPAMVVCGWFTGLQLSLGLPPSAVVMLVLTLVLSIVTFANGRTNVLQGAVHIVLFCAYLLLLFQG
jgi:Ca2+:H+ antiporter